MGRSPHRSGVTSGASGRDGRGRGTRSSGAVSHGYYTSERTTTTSTPGDYAYGSSRQSTYIQVPQSSRPEHARLNDMVESPALYKPPIPSHPQNQANHFYNAPHSSLTDYASSHLRILPYEVSDYDFNPSPSHRAPSSAERFAQRDRERYQNAIGGYYPSHDRNQTYDPYDAVGYIRRDGQVYRETRPYDPNAQQHGHQERYGSNGASR